MASLISNNNVRKFEIPYNFDPQYLQGLKALNLDKNASIEYIYVAPFHEDYIGVKRFDLYGANQLTREQYVEHIKAIRELFDGKMQLLLQKRDYIMPLETLKWYIDLGFIAFCCGNVEQAKLIKNYDNSLTTISSITLHMDEESIKKPDNDEFFDLYVLDFSFGKNIQKIKMMPQNKKYLILVNSICNINCRGDNHWFLKNEFDSPHCPGKLSDGAPFEQTTLIRPMDLYYFDPYIEVYKLQDRSWSTHEILKDIVLYMTDYSIYPGIEYSEFLYEQDVSKG